MKSAEVPDPGTPPGGNRNMIPLLVTIFLDFLGFGIVLPIIAPVFLDQVHGILPAGTPYPVRTSFLGLLIASFPVAQFFGAPVLGVISDKYGRKKVLMISIAGTALSLSIFGFGIAARNVTLLFCSRLLNGLTGGNVSTAQSAIADMSDPQSKAKNFGLIGMAFGLGFILGPFVGGELADPDNVSWFTYSTPFWCASLLSLFNVGLIWRWFNETLRYPQSDLRITFMGGIHYIRSAFARPELRTILGVVFLTMVGFTFFTQFFQVYIISRFHYRQVDIGEMYAYIGIWIALTQGVLTRLLARKFPPVAILRLSIFFLGLGFFCLLLPQQSLYLYVVLPIVAVAQGITMPNATALVSNAVTLQDQGEILGINQSVQSIAFALPPVIAGVMTAIDIRLPILLASFFAFFAWIVFIIVFHVSEKKSQV